MSKQEECLNRKTKWGGAKISSLLVNSPKGLAKDFRKPNDKDRDNIELQEPTWLLEEVIRRGHKRLNYIGDDSKLEDEVYQEPYTGKP